MVKDPWLKLSSRMPSYRMSNNKTKHETLIADIDEIL